MPEQKRLSLAGIGCGSRTRTYMKLAMEQKDRYRIAAAADPVKQRTEAVRDFAPEEERDSIRLFKDAASLLEEPRLADGTTRNTRITQPSTILTIRALPR
jgi:hypothetical protein